MGTLHDRTLPDEAQAELGRRAHAMIPHTPAPPPVPAMQPLKAAPAEPPDVLHVLLRRQALVWMLWGGKP
jgi:hypothetical protein